MCAIGERKTWRWSGRQERLLMLSTAIFVVAGESYEITRFFCG